MAQTLQVFTCSDEHLVTSQPAGQCSYHQAHPTASKQAALNHGRVTSVDGRGLHAPFTSSCCRYKNLYRQDGCLQAAWRENLTGSYPCSMKASRWQALRLHAYEQHKLFWLVVSSDPRGRVYVKRATLPPRASPPTLIYAMQTTGP